MTTARYLIGDVFERMAELEDGSVDLIMTSPPFLALRSVAGTRGICIGARGSVGVFYLGMRRFVLLYQHRRTNLLLSALGADQSDQVRPADLQFFFGA